MFGWSEKCPPQSLSARRLLYSSFSTFSAGLLPPALFTTSSFCCFSLTYPTCSRNASANSHFSFRLLCFTQVLPRCELLFSLNRSWELSVFSSDAAFSLVLVIVGRWLFTPKALNFFFRGAVWWRARWREGAADTNSVSLAAGASGRQRRVVVKRGRWMCWSAGGRLVV